MISVPSRSYDNSPCEYRRAFLYVFVRGDVIKWWRLGRDNVVLEGAFEYNLP